MAYVINTCLYGGKCESCKHHRFDPEHSYAEDPRDRYACYIDEDLQGEERKAYMIKLYKHFKALENN